MANSSDQALAKTTKVEYIKICIKERLKGADYPPSKCEFSDKRVEITILRCLCDVTSPDHYYNCIHELLKKEKERLEEHVSCATQTRSQTQYLEELDQLIASKTPHPPSTNKIANILLQSFKETWTILQIILKKQKNQIISLPNYIETIEKAKKPENLITEQAEEHTKIMKTLMDLLRDELQLLDVIQEKVILQLLSLAYCILQFCYTRAQQPGNPQHYIRLRRFLSDMVITFLLLESVVLHDDDHYEGSCKLSHDSLPEIEKVKIHLLKISPADLMFRELVLWEILKILYDDLPRIPVLKEDTQDARVRSLAKSVYDYFSIYPFRRLKTPDTLCCIINNQSHYMATHSPLLKECIEDDIEEKIMKLHKNFVSERTAHAIFENLTHVPCIKDVISAFNDRGMNTAAFVMSYNDHSTKCNKYCKIIQYPIKLKSFEQDLNSLHHAILVDAVHRLHTFLGLPPLPLDNQCWFIDENFNVFLRDLVRKLIAKYRQNQSRAELYKLMTTLAKSLQYVIYARWLLCENYDQPGIAMNNEGAKHQKVFFIFLAMRTIIMYLLPVSYCGELSTDNTGLSSDNTKLSSDNTKILPQYAIRLRFKLDIHCPYV